MKTKMICRDCKTEFVLRPNKPGYINQCEDCAVDVPRLGGNMIYSHKTAPTIEIKPLAEAKNFARLTRRLGAGVTASLTCSKELSYAFLNNIGDYQQNKLVTGTESREWGR